jgi:hypothetical protein
LVLLLSPELESFRREGLSSVVYPVASPNNKHTEGNLGRKKAGREGPDRQGCRQSLSEEKLEREGTRARPVPWGLLEDEPLR